MTDKLILDGDIQGAKKNRAKPSSSSVSPASKKRDGNTIQVPGIYLWGDKTNGLICGAFRWGGGPWGLCFPYADNAKRREMDRKHLRVRLRDSLDILIHHGEDAMKDDKNKNHVEKIRDAEANRHYLDPMWAKKVEAFKRSVVYKEISKEEATKLKLR